MKAKQLAKVAVVVKKCAVTPPPQKAAASSPLRKKDDPMTEARRQRRCVVSKAYHKAQVEAINIGCSLEKSQQLARDAHVAAGIEFDRDHRLSNRSRRGCIDAWGEHRIVHVARDSSRWGRIDVDENGIDLES